MHGSGLYIMLASSIWGIDGFVRQNVSLPETFLLTVEMVLAGCIVLAWTFIKKKKEIRKIRKLPSFIATIVIGGFAGSWLFVHALRATDSLGLVFVLTGLQPIFAILFSALFLGEKPKGSFYIFAATATSASILVTLGDTGWDMNNSSMVAYLYALLTAVCWGISTIFEKIVDEHNSISYSIGLRFVSIGFIAGGISYLTEEIPLGSLGAYIGSPTFLVSLLFLIFVSDILAEVIYQSGLKSVPAALATMFELTFPLTGFLLDYMINDVVPSPLKIVAAITVLMSIIILPYCHFIEENKPIGNLSLA